jgi:hypothetical protein
MFEKASEQIKPRITDAFSGKDATKTVNKPSSRREQLFAIINSTLSTPDEKLAAFDEIKDIEFNRKKVKLEQDIKPNLLSISELNTNRPTTDALVEAGIERYDWSKTKNGFVNENRCIHCGEETGKGELQAFCERCLAIHSMVGIMPSSVIQKADIKSKLTISSKEEMDEIFSKFKDLTPNIENNKNDGEGIEL